jgi:hypothetical protein
LKRKVEQKKRISKTSLKSCKTIDDLFTVDDINQMLEDLNSDKADITDCIIIYKRRNGSINWEISDETLTSTAVWLLESTKNDVLNEDCED